MMTWLRIVLLGWAFTAASGCQSGTTGGGQDSGIIIGGDDGGSGTDQSNVNMDGAVNNDATGGVLDLTAIDQTGLDLCAPLTVMIVHPESGSCRVPGSVFFRGLVFASCVDITANVGVTFSWSTTPTSGLDGKTGNDQNATMALGSYTITLTVSYMGKMASMSMPFSITNPCP